MQGMKERLAVLAYRRARWPKTRLELGDAALSCMKAAVRPEVHVKRHAVSTHRPFRPENTSAPTAATKSGEWPAFP